MPQSLRILVLENIPADVESIELELKKAGMNFETFTVDKIADFLMVLDTQEPDLILANHHLPQFNSIQAIEIFKKKKLAIPFILVTDPVNEEFAASIIKLGADDYILKSNLIRLPDAIEASLKHKQSDRKGAESELETMRKTLQRNAAFMEALPDLILMVNKEGVFTDYHNPKGIDTLMPPKDFLQKTVFEILPTHLANATVHHVQLALEKGGQPKFQYQLPYPEGNRDFEARCSKVNEDEVMVIVTDITEKKKIEEELKNSELLFRSLTTNAPVAIYQTNLEGECSFVNEEWMKYAGMNSKEAMGTGWTNALHPEDKERVFAEWQAAVNNNEEFISEYRFQKKSGTSTWLSSKAVAMINSAGETVGYIGVAKDITTRKIAEERLKKSEYLVREIFNSKVIGFFYFDANGEILDANDFFLQTFGYTKQDLLDGNLNWNKMTPPEYVERDQLALKELAETGVCLPFEKVFICKDGSQLPILIGGAMIQEENTSKGFAYVMDNTELKKAKEETVASEMRFRALIENNEGIITLADENLKIVYRSKSNNNITGWDFKEYESLNPEEYIHPDDLDIFKGLMAETLANPGKPLTCATRIRHKNGHYIWTEGTVKNMLHDPAVKGIIANMKDISERKIAEEEIIKSELLFRTLTSNAPVAIFRSDLDGKGTYVNEEWLKYSGMEYHEAMEFGWLNAIHQEDRERVSKAWEKAVREFSDFSSEMRFVNKEGKITWLLSKAVPLRDAQHNVYGYIGISSDFTESKKSAEELQLTLRKLEEAQEVSGLGHWEIDLATSKRIWSKQVFKNFNFPIAKEAPDVRTVRQHVHPEDREQMKTNFEKITQGGQPDNFIMKTNPEFGPLKYLLSSWHLIHNDRGEVEKMIGTSQDITNVKEIELKLVEQNEALKKANTELDRFVYSASHDLRAPLKSVLGLTDILYSKLENEKDDERFLLEMMRNSVEKLDNFIEDILDYSRNARIEIQFEELNFDEIIEDTKRNHKFMEGAEHVILNRDIKLKSAIVSDLGRMKIILNNLISNAVKYHNPTSTNSFVLIKIRGDQDKVQIEVSDNGIGIAPKDQEKIFEMFYRATKLSTGSGLGMYIVKETVAKLGGTIRLESELGKGTKFIIMVPNQLALLN